MKTRTNILLVLLLMLAAAPLFSQVNNNSPGDKEAEIKRKNEARKKWKKEKARKDSLDIASLPDSVKNKPMILLPGFKIENWQVLDHIHYKDSSEVEYKRPSYSTGKGNTKKEEKPLDMYYIANCTLPGSKDTKGEVWFHKGGEKHGRLYKAVHYYYSSAEISKVVPAPVLEKIRKELQEQAGEEIRSLAVSESSESITSTEIINGNMVEKPVAKKVYWVWGTKNGSKTNGSYYFTMEGNYIPVYEHDAAHNKKYKAPK
jgi:hypothetical protein